jgi:hypothetical protein
MTNIHSTTSGKRRSLQLPTRAAFGQAASVRAVQNPQQNKEREIIIKTIVGSLLNMKLQHKRHVLPRHAYTDILQQYKTICDITYSSLKNRVSREYKKHVLYKKYDHVDTVLSPPPPDDDNTIATLVNKTSKPGRPKGSTDESKLRTNTLVAQVRDKITIKYNKELLKAQQKSSFVSNRVKQGTFEDIKKKIISQVEQDLPTSFTFSYNTAMKHISRKTLRVAFGKNGPCSPLIDIEDDLCELLILFGNTGSALKPPEVIRFTNSLIQGTPTQKKLISWKRKSNIKGTDAELGRVGLSYFNNFMKRNKEKLRSKRGKRFELNREKWQTYTNFARMYEDHEFEMIDAGVAKKLETPVWMNRKGERVSNESQVYGCKVTTQLTRPDMVITMDEVGCNTSQLHDGHVGGTRYVVGKTKEPRQLSTKKDKHFTCLGLTLLTGQPLMCVIIIEGKVKNYLVESGVDSEAQEIRKQDESEIEHYMNNMGKNKKYPCGPTCTYNDIDIPCLVEFSESGGITPSILVKIFATLDHLDLFGKDRENGLRPYAILDGHSSRFDIEFLRYINDSSHRWSVVIGVPYGTALWQVGDSVQQNGMFKVWLVKRKEFLMNKRDDMNSNMEIVPTDIVPLVTYAWNKSFA